MNTKLVILRSEESVKSAIKKMKQYEISQLPVIDNGLAVGFMSESILLEKIIEGNSENAIISDVMQNSPPVIPGEASRTIVAGLLKQFPLVLVKEKNKIKGIITKSDLLGALYKN